MTGLTSELVYRVALASVWSLFILQQRTFGGRHGTLVSRQEQMLHPR
jgi:hypothetical protein